MTKEIEYTTLHTAAHINPENRLNELGKEGWRVICFDGKGRLILCREVKIPVKTIPLDMLPSDEGGLAQKAQKGD